MIVWIDRYAKDPYWEASWRTRKVGDPFPSIDCRNAEEAIKRIKCYYWDIIRGEILYGIPRETYDEEIEFVDLEACEENIPFLQWCEKYDFYPPIRIHESRAPRMEKRDLQNILSKHPDWVTIQF